MTENQFYSYFLILLCMSLFIYVIFIEFYENYKELKRIRVSQDLEQLIIEKLNIIKNNRKEYNKYNIVAIKLCNNYNYLYNEIKKYFVVPQSKFLYSNYGIHEYYQYFETSGDLYNLLIKNKLNIDISDLFEEIIQRNDDHFMDNIFLCEHNKNIYLIILKEAIIGHELVCLKYFNEFDFEKQTHLMGEK